MIKRVLNINGSVYKTSSMIYCELSYLQKITDCTEIVIYLKAYMQSLSGTPISKKLKLHLVTLDGLKNMIACLLEDILQELTLLTSGK